METSLTVFFDDPFWVGVFERLADGRYAVARVVFGAEPSDAEVYVLVRDRWRALVFTVSDSTEGARALPRRRSPKRARREAGRALERTGPGTRAQRALQLALEAHKTVSAAERRAEEALDAEHRYQLRVEKRKRRHRGH